MISIRHRDRVCDVRFLSWPEIQAELPPGCLMVTDGNVAQALDIQGAIVVPAGEASKSPEQLTHLLEAFAERGLSRSGAVAAVGGGVVGDLAGFAAAVYMRGVPVIQVPTTVVAMIDSAIGGKTGIDLEHGKNLAGAFHPPTQVLIPLHSLQTLPEREYVSGLAEAYKYAYIAEPELAAALRDRPERRLLCEETITRCILHKKRVVELDEFEKTGVRAMLNFGHTVGHAIEKLTGYCQFTHGEAVAIGMVKEAELGERLGVTEGGTAETIRQDLEREGLPTRCDFHLDQLLETMRLDKKNAGEGLTFSLLPRLGECKLFAGLPADEVRKAWDPK